MGKLSFLVLCLGASIFAKAADNSSFRFSNQPGTYAVGFRVVLQYDYSRVYPNKVDFAGKPVAGERARPIQTLIWYPAQKSSAGSMTYGDYLALFATEESFSPTQAEAAEIVRRKEKEEGADASPAAPMWAVRDAKPESGPYPLVIYAPSFSAPAFENVDLCEYLASHGYLVMASPDMGAHTRDMTADLEGVEAQARDISFLIGFARTIPQADLGHVAVAGFSWGGLSNLFAAAKDDRIDALIDLDGSARYFPKLIQDSKYVRPREMTLPLLFFTQAEIPLEDMDGDDVSGNVLNQMTHSDVYIVRMHAMKHGEFSSLHERSPSFWKEHQSDEYSPQEVSESYSWVARYALQFLNATFKNDSAASQFLKNTPTKNGVPAHVLTPDIRPAKGIPFTIEAMAVELTKRGFDHTHEVYEEIKAQNPEMQISQGKINAWGWGLLEENHLPEAIEVFKLNVTLYPNSSGAYEDLGEAYERNGQKDLAIEDYKKSLEKDPKNRAAERHLKEIQAGK